jgi:chemotaxis protein CheD
MIRESSVRRKASKSDSLKATKRSKLQQAITPFTPANPAYYSLKPGELFVGEEVAQVETLLGSCVAVVMFSPRTRVGAICHSLLPSCRNEEPCVTSCLQGPRFVDCSILRMLDWFLQRGIQRRELVVKLFGGSDMFAAAEDESTRKGIGQQNIERAMQVLEQEGLTLMASDVGGLRGRKIIFRTYTGEIFLKRLNRSELK